MGLTLAEIRIRRGDRLVIDGIDLTVEGGSLVQLFGPNGAGKTTLMQAAAGLLAPGQGQVKIDGHPLYAPGSAPLRRRIGLLTHETFLYGDLTLRENLEFYGRAYGISGDDRSRRAGQLLEYLDIALVADDPVRRLSRGLRQRAALARVLLHRPDVLLLDEPLTGLDAQTVARVLRLLQQQSEQGAALLLSSHDPDSTASLPGRRVVLAEGALHEGPVEEAAAARQAALEPYRHVLGEGDPAPDAGGSEPGLGGVGTPPEDTGAQPGGGS